MIHTTTTTNLFSICINKNLVRHFGKSAKAHLVVTPMLDEIIIGSMLGDLTAERPTPSSNTRLQFKQASVNEPYVDHLYSLFNEYCGSKPINLSRFDSRPNRAKFHNAIKFQTLNLPCFNKYKELFYNTEGIKIIPSNLKDLLTERGLAYWIMDDGYKYTQGLYISTDSYTFEETEFLCDILRTKFGLECNPHKYRETYRIYISSKSMDKLILMVKPYFIEHFFYKLSLN